VIEPGFEVNGGEEVNFLYSPDWASRFEVWPAKKGLMIANVVGAQQGLGVAGFCYVSYKFVYDMYFPVMVQISSGDNPEELFQFPIAVVVNKNQPREAVISQAVVAETAESVCDNSITDISIYTYDNSLAPIEADIDFKCFTDICSLGTTNKSGGNAILETEVPQCVNGVLIANAEGYAEEKYFISTNDESIADIVLDKEYGLELDVYVDGKLTQDLSVLVISKNEEDGSIGEIVETVAYPSLNELDLSEGDYNFELKVYTRKSIDLPESEQRQCVDVPREGVLGLFGLKDEKCFDYVIPGQKISNLLYSGGSQNQYITQSELATSNKIKLYATSANLPDSVEKLQETYDLIEAKNLRIDLI